MAKQPNQYTKRSGSVASPSSSRQTSFGEDLSSHNLDWLQDRAQKLGIEGRSSMNKDQLIQAIQRKKQ